MTALGYLRYLLVFCLLIVVSAETQAQSPPPPTVPGVITQAPQKYPQLATILGVVIPGGGQLYAGRPAKGGLILAGWGAAIVGGIASSCWACGEDYAYDLRPYYGGLAIAAGLWVYGFVTAGHDAQMANKKNAQRIGLIPVIDRQEGRLQVGLSIALNR